MSLESGTRLGHYEVVSSLGAGGMGEVYRARDARLGRDVAIKVLPATFSSDPDARRRLEREARAISSLSHPNVCPLFDIGHADGLDFLVMEYLEGETLATRLERGPLSVADVLRVGGEIAAALAAAHRRGIVHRDLKPGNVMLTRSRTRLLDFGLAKAANAPEARGVQVTLTAPLTAQGTLVGTFPYMSPEQVEGRDVDARSDIFSLGAVLYEMATGKRAFDGSTAASVIAGILERQPPPLSALQPLAPAALEDVVRGCLAKDPDERWQTAQDVKLQLDGLARRMALGRDQESVATVSGRSAAGRRLGPVALMLLALLAGLGIGVLGPWRREATTGAGAEPLVRAPLVPPRGHAFTPRNFALSPDGLRAAYVAAGPDGVTALWASALSSGQAQRIEGTEGAAGPFWSPDGRWIAFFARNRLLKVEPGGSGIQEICPISFNAGFGAWGARGDILFSGSVLGPLLRVPDSGGTPSAVTKVPDDMPGEAHRFPEFLPDGDRFLYLASWTNQQRGGIYLARISGGEPELVSPDIRGRVVLAGAHLLFGSSGVLYAQPFDLEGGRLTGERRVLLRNEVTVDWRFGELPVSASSTGILLYQSPVSYNSRLVWFDRGGTELESVGEAGFTSPVLSPDGRRVAVTHDRDGSGNWTTTILDLGRKVHYPLPQAGIQTAHAWSPDGQWIYYSALRDSNGIFRRRADGSGDEEVLLKSNANLMLNTIAPAGPPRMLYMDFSAGTAELRELHLETRQFRTLAVGAEGAYSPDGEWVAFVGPVGVVLIRVVGDEARVQISRGIGAQVRWNPDMKELFYMAPDRTLMAVPLQRRNGLIEPGTPVPLFQTRVVEPRLVLFQYDTPDGKRFLINSLPRQDIAAPLTLLVNWPRALQR